MTDSDIRSETWKPIPGFSRYEASDRGLIRHIATARIMATNPNKDGYLRLNLVSDDGRKGNVLVHRCVLLAHAGSPGDGQEACHGEGGQRDNRYPENLRWGTKPENERDKIAAGHKPQPVPTFFCRGVPGFPGCGKLVIHEGRRCVDCLPVVGREATAMLSRGMNLMDVADHFGYTGPDWVYKLAVEHGGCTISKRDALTQQPPHRGFSLRTGHGKSHLARVTLSNWIRRRASGDSV